MGTRHLGGPLMQWCSALGADKLVPYKRQVNLCCADPTRGKEQDRTLACSNFNKKLAKTPDSLTSDVDMEMTRPWKERALPLPTFYNSGGVRNEVQGNRRNIYYLVPYKVCFSFVHRVFFFIINTYSKGLWFILEK